MDARASVKPKMVISKSQDNRNANKNISTDNTKITNLTMSSEQEAPNIARSSKEFRGLARDGGPTNLVFDEPSKQKLKIEDAPQMASRSQPTDIENIRDFLDAEDPGKK